jgi:hypothetical protein
MRGRALSPAGSHCRRGRAGQTALQAPRRQGATLLARKDVNVVPRVTLLPFHLVTTNRQQHQSKVSGASGSVGLTPAVAAVLLTCSLYALLIFVPPRQSWPTAKYVSPAAWTARRAVVAWSRGSVTAAVFMTCAHSAVPALPRRHGLTLWRGALPILSWRSWHDRCPECPLPVVGA